MAASILRWLLAAVLVAHGVAHAAGFAVAFRLTASPQIPYHTTLINGRLDAGDAGIRIVGLLWLAMTGAFVASAVLVAVRHPLAFIAIIAAATASLLLCALEWPYAHIGVVVNAALLLALPAIAGVMWRSDSRDAVTALHQSTRPMPAAPDPSRLPEPVARYFSRVLPPDPSSVRVVDIVHKGEFFVGGRWRRLESQQQYTITPPGFVWDAGVALLPLATVRVRDAYVAGKGSMTADFMGLYPVVRQRDRRELDAGALHRFLAEAVWFPTALLPAAGVHWRPLNQHAALATLTDGFNEVSLEFRFTADGDVREVFTAERFAESNGRYVPTPWLVRCSQYESHEGFRIPVRCEVEWQFPTGARPYWRGRVVDIRYRTEGDS